MAVTVVVGTSVLVGALIGAQRPNREIIRRCLLGKYNPLISNPLFQEYKDVSNPFLPSPFVLSEVEGPSANGFD